MLNLTVEQSNLLYFYKGNSKEKTIENLKNQFNNMGVEDYFARDIEDLILQCIKVVENMQEEDFKNLKLSYEE